MIRLKFITKVILSKHQFNKALLLTLLFSVKVVRRFCVEKACCGGGVRLFYSGKSVKTVKRGGKLHFRLSCPSLNTSAPL